LAQLRVAALLIGAIIDRDQILPCINGPSKRGRTIRIMGEIMSTSLKAYTTRLSALLALAVLVACGDSETSAPAGPTPVATVAITPSAESLLVGEQLVLDAEPRSVDGRPVQRPVTWHSANETIASVSVNGTVTAIAPGRAAISATSEGKAGWAQIVVTAPPIVPVAEVRLNVDTTVVLEFNGSKQLRADALDANGNVLPGRAVQWVSSRPAVATVSDDGLVVAKSAGNAIIGATIEGQTSMVGVRVNPAPVASISISGDPSSLELGETMFLAASVKGEDGQPTTRPVTWTTSAPAVITIEPATLSLVSIRALAAGTVTLTASADGKSTSVTFTVTPPPAQDLIYSRWNGEASEIFVLGLGGGSVAPVRLNAGNVSRDPSPSPDGLRYVFAVSQTNPTTGQAQHDLYVVDRNGMNMRWLTRADGVEDQPVWSPDGTRILFHGIDAQSQRSDLYVINVDGSGQTNLTAHLSPAMTDKREPAWSPDGSRIAFVGAVGGQHKIWIINADGSNAVQLTRDTGFDVTPAWSPAGDRIAFSRYNTADPTLGNDIMIVPVATGVPQRLPLIGDQFSPAFSPDGHYIAFSGTVLTGRGVAQLYTMRYDVTGLRLRTVNPAWGGGVQASWIRR